MTSKEIKKSLENVNVEPITFHSRTQSEWIKEYMPKLYEKSIETNGEAYIGGLPLRLNSDLAFIKSYITKGRRGGIS